MDLKVLWTTFTANQASRMREVFENRIDVNTCHAAFGFDEDLTSVANSLAPYGFVVVDEFQQLPLLWLPGHRPPIVVALLSQQEARA